MTIAYSDLPPEQKLIFIKRSVILGICMLIPFLIGIGLFFSAVGDFSQSTGIPPQDIELKTDDTYKGNGGALAGLVIFIIVSAYIGVIVMGAFLGEFVCDLLKLYTDKELERAKKRLKKIEDAKK